MYGLRFICGWVDKIVWSIGAKTIHAAFVIFHFSNKIPHYKNAPKFTSQLQSIYKNPPNLQVIAVLYKNKPALGKRRADLFCMKVDEINKVKD